MFLFFVTLDVVLILFISRSKICIHIMKSYVDNAASIADVTMDDLERAIIIIIISEVEHDPC